MSYTQQQFPDDPSEFPAPPEWLVWTGERGSWNYKTQQWEPFVGPKRGQVRHMYTLSKAKKRVSYDGTFQEDWRIYQWDGKQYQLQYSGNYGDVKDDNPLFKTRLKKGQANIKLPDLDDSKVDAAIASILKGAGDG